MGAWGLFRISSGKGATEVRLSELDVRFVRVVSVVESSLPSAKPL